MRCQNCNNELTEGTTVCPYCGAQVNSQTDNNLSTTSVLPVTPTSPVLPTDQNMVVSDVKPATPIENVVTPDTQAIPVIQNQVSTNEMVQENTVPVNSAVEAPTHETPQVQNNVVPEVNIVDVPKMDYSTQEPSKVENTISPEYIAPNGEVLDGTKLDSIKKEDPIIKKKKRKKLIIILIIVLVICLLGGLAYYFYYTQYKTSSKRIDAIVSYLTSSTKTLTNDNIEASSGTYSASLNVTYDDKKFSTEIDGTYAKDLVAGAYDLTINLESLYNNEDMINSPLNFELYYNDSKVYVLLQNFYENYIYDEVGDTYDFSEQISQNDINYTTIISGLKTAIGAGLKGMSSTQSFGDRTIDGETKKVNIITFSMTDNNQKKFMNAFFKSLSNNSNFLTQISTITGYEVDDIKAYLTVDNMTFTSSNTKIEIYTSMFKQEFEGIKISNTDDNITNVITIYPITNGYKINYKEGSQDILKLNYTKTTKKTSTATEKTISINGTMYINEIAYTADLSVLLSEDVNTKSAKVNVKNSINRANITNEDKNTIVEASKNIGELGLTLPNIISSYLGVEENTRNMNLTETDANMDSCTLVTDCIDSNISGYSICKNTTTESDVICDNTWITTTTENVG